MAEAHIGSVLPIKNRVLGVDEHTTFLAHYDLNEHDVLRGIKAVASPNALSFDGAKSYVETNQLFDFSTTESFSVTFWIKFGDHSHKSSAAAGIIGKGHWYENTWDIFLTNGNQITFEVGGETMGRGSLNTAPGINQWHHIAAVYDNGAMSLYTNGVRRVSRNYTGTGVFNGSRTVKIGQRHTDTSRVLQGEMHSAAIWNRALSENEIIENMNGIFPESGMLAHWKLNEGEGMVARDSSAFHNDAEIKDASWVAGNSIFTLRPQEGKFGGAIAVEQATTNEVASYVDELENLSIGSFHDFVYPSAAMQNATVRYHRLGKHHWKMEFMTDFPGRMQIGFTNAMNWSVQKTLSYDIADYHLAPGSTSSFSVSRVSYGNVYNNDVGKKTLVYTPTESFSGSTQVGFRTTWSDDIWVKAGSYIEFKNIQVEVGNIATSFVDGRRGDGKLHYPVKSLGISKDSGTISCWYYVTDYTKMLEGGIPYVFRLQRSGGGVGILFYHSVTSPRWYVFTYPDTGDRGSISFDNSITPNGWNHFAISWGEGKIKAYVNGVLVGEANNLLESIGDALEIGSSAKSNIIDELRIDRIARTEEEILAWYESNSPFWPRGIYRTAD